MFVRGDNKAPVCTTFKIRHFSTLVTPTPLLNLYRKQGNNERCSNTHTRRKVKKLERSSVIHPEKKRTKCLSHLLLLGALTGSYLPRCNLAGVTK